MKARWDRGAKGWLLVTLVVSACFLSACTDGDENLVWALTQAWASDHYVYDRDTNELSPQAAVMEVFDQTYGKATNSEDAVAINGLDVIDQIAQADADAEQALFNLDYDAIDTAIDKRPKDWTYREDKVVIALANNNREVAAEAIKESNRVVQEAIDAGGDCLSLRRNQLEHRIETIDRQLDNAADLSSQEIDLLQKSRNAAVEDWNLADAPGGFCAADSGE